MGIEEFRITAGIGLAFFVLVGIIGYFLFKFVGERNVKDDGGGRKETHTRGDNHDRPREDEGGRQ